MSKNPKPMSNDHRKLVYLRQNGSVSRLTGAQRRRLRKNAKKGR